MIPLACFVSAIGASNIGGTDLQNPKRLKLVLLCWFDDGMIALMNAFVMLEERPLTLMVAGG
ncbi:MAG: hypothetical protein DMF77_17105 [Acidobacteria bacterium]|nr:MAG: hypothetical protein DMF77_17105 [Acidobacteriota bacterium]